VLTARAILARGRVYDRPIERFDAIVVGAGPAGSLTAYRLAQAGASVLLVDRAGFPRDKPCGGGLTIRAARLLPFSIDAVVEDVVEHVELRFRHGPARARDCAHPVVLMTQRRRLDAFLAERAAEAGAAFRDGVRVTAVRETAGGAIASVDGRTLHARVVIGADGANGVTARSLGLCVSPFYGVALEGNLADASAVRRQRGAIVFELGNLPGGYGWIFAKRDHLNVGVGGVSDAGPLLREQLRRFCAAHGIRYERLTGVRGYRLPLARSDAVLARGTTLVVGDAAGLVDPLSGDGIYGALVSAGLAAEATLDVLGGRAPGLEAYDAAVRQALERERAVSWAAKVALDRFPRLMAAAARTELAQDALERLARGDARPPGLRLGPRTALAALRLGARLARPTWAVSAAANG